MNQRTKTAVLIGMGAIAVLVSFGFAGMYGFRAFTRNIFESKSCEWANIDHIELRARVNIPATENCDCRYDRSANTKTSVFQLNDHIVNLDTYIPKNQFKPVTKADLAGLPQFPDADLDSKSGNLFFRKGTSATHDYCLLLNKETAKLGVQISYKD